jgi:hypothetical protein
MTKRDQFVDLVGRLFRWAGFSIAVVAALLLVFSAGPGSPIAVADHNPTPTVQTIDDTGNVFCEAFGLLELTRFDPPADGTQNGVTIDINDAGTIL